jgi:hypothetical protein
MAGTIEHLTIAWELMKKWEEDAIYLQYPDFFLAGNICPDGIQAREHYERAMKKHTHFRDGIADEDFGKEENRSLFHQRVENFYKTFFLAEQEEQKKELYLGYLTHILTDEYFMLTVRPDFMRCMKKIGLSEHDSETFVKFTYDVNQNDFRLARQHPGMKQIYTYLKNITPYEIPQLLTAEELNRSRQWILQFFFDDAPSGREAQYYTYDKMTAFLQNATSYLKKHITVS